MLPSNNQDRKYQIRPQESTSSESKAYVGFPTGTYIPDSNIATLIATNESNDTSRLIKDISNITDKAVEYLRIKQNSPQVNQLMNLMNMLLKELKGYDLPLPKMLISLAEDNSLALSWSVGTAYFGVTVFQDIRQSSWFLIQGGTRGYKADGYLEDPDFKTQLPTQISLLIKYFFK